MGSKYPVLRPTEIIKCIEKFGFEFKSQKGSHVKYTNGNKTTIIPMHDEVAKGTLKGILELTDIPLEEFLKKL